MTPLKPHYVGRAKGDITAAHAAYAQDGKARLVVNVTVKDSENKDVMQAVAHWYIWKRK